MRNAGQGDGDVFGCKEGDEGRKGRKRVGRKDGRERKEGREV